MHSKYRYLGYLRQIPATPDPDALTQVNHIAFSAENLEQWNCADDPAEKEWLNVPVRVGRTEDGNMQLRGHFEDIRRIDNLDRKDPRFWAPLSLTSQEDPRFPLDCSQYPIAEVTYRCTTSHACPACQWTYPGGAHLVHLEPSRNWQTAAMLLQYRNFPKTISRFTVRLYASWRSTESMEIAEVRFRALLPDEAAKLQELYVDLDRTAPPGSFPLLDEFLPFGVTMNVGTAEQLAELLDISFFDYFRLSFEDIVRHHHNCISLEGMQLLSADDRNVLIELAENFGLRLIPTFDWPMDRFDQEGDDLIASHIKPHADSNGVLAWNIQDAPTEQHLANLIKARDKIAEADPNHPLTIHLRQADAFSFFAPFFAASGFSYFRSAEPAAVAESLRTHLPMVGGQQFWVTAPAFVYASDAPNWCTSPQLRLMLNSILANGARGWLAHTYHNTPVWVDGHCERSLAGPFLTFSDLWAELGNRVERLAVMSPLFLSARPAEPPPHLQIVINYQKNPKTQVREGAETISMSWLKGPDYYLFYLVNNDTDQTTSVNMSLPETQPDGLEVYDTTALVRNRAWEPAPHERHFEMFPGQGQLYLIAQPPVCAHWREVIARRILQADQRQTRVDLELARQYGLDLRGIEAALSNNAAASLEELNQAHGARERLFNLIYATPDIYEPRQVLVKASSIIRGCDEALSVLHGRGKTEIARELGVKVLPLSRTLTVLRLQLRRGHGARIKPEAASLAQSALDLLRDIWNRS